MYKRKWIVLLIYMYVTVVSRMIWLTFASIITDLETRLNVPASSLMWFSLIFVIALVVLAVPSGIIIDKKGFKFGVGIGTVFLGIFPLLRLVDPHSFTLLILAQIGAAIGPPFIINGVTKFAVTWFPPEEEGTAIGFASLSLFLGIMLALGGTPWLVVHFSYETMLMVYSILSFVGMVVFLFFVPSKPSGPSFISPHLLKSPPFFSDWGGLKVILKLRDYKLLCGVVMIAFGVFNGLVSWIQKILSNVHQLSLLDTGKVSMFLMFGGILGCIIMPILSDKVQKRKPFMIIALVAGIVGLIGLIGIRDPAIIRLDASLLGFFLLSGLPIVFSMSVAIVGPARAGVSIGMFRMLGDITSMITIPLAGHLSVWTGSFISTLLFFMLMLIVALVLTLFMKDYYRFNV